MTKPDPRLQNLADIQEPQLLSDWYLAPIWWVLAVCILLLCWWGFRRWRRHQLKQRPRQLAQQALAMVNLAQPTAPHQISAVLKRYLLTLAPTHPALTLSGQQWQQFLLQTSTEQSEFTLPDLLALHYQPSPSVDDVAAYAKFAQHWLLHHQTTLAANIAPTSAGVRDV